MIYPAWTVAPSVYPDWLGVFDRWRQGDIHLLPAEQRLMGMLIELRVANLYPEFRRVALAPEMCIAVLSRENRLVSLPHEERIERLRKGMV